MAQKVCEEVGGSFAAFGGAEFVDAELAGGETDDKVGGEY